jgi:hypothetical protein
MVKITRFIFATDHTQSVVALTLHGELALSGVACAGLAR